MWSIPKSDFRYNLIYNVICRYTEKWIVNDSVEDNAGHKLIRAGSPKDNVPNEVELFSGSAYIIATREFIYWTMRSEIPENLIKWSQDTFSPDEMIWATLTRIQEAPGMILEHRPYGHLYNL